MSDAIALLDTPVALRAIEHIGENTGNPILPEDVCLWVGKTTRDEIIARSELMPIFPALEPADLWATSGVVIYEEGLDIGWTPGSDPTAEDTESVGRRVGAQQWWTARKGLVIVSYFTFTLDSWVECMGETASYTSRRWRTSDGAETLTVQSLSTSANPDFQEVDIREDETLKFATPGDRPLLIGLPSDAEGVTYVWPWGAGLKPMHEDDVDYWMPEEAFGPEDYRREAPSMAYAAERSNGPPECMLSGDAWFYSCFWTLMQTAAAPASSVLPRRMKRSLERQAKERKNGTSAPNLWIVDVPRALPNPEPTKTHGGGHSYRYPVRGHWRNQWYPSIQGRKPIWITEHIRGPRSAALLDARVEWAKEHPVYRLRIPSKTPAHAVPRT